MEVTLKILVLTLLVICQANGYSEALSSKMIDLSRAIYDISKQDQAANKCPECYKDYKVLDQILGNKILALVGVDHKLQSIVAVFRGSENIANFLTDANILTSEYDGDKACKKCNVHRGFENSYNRLVNKGFKEAINKAVDENPTYSVIFTGHSLGGAVANLAAVAFKRQHPKASVSLYTFGQPRVGNGNYAEYVNKNVPENYRIVHKKDIVPHKPSYYIKYRHSGTEIWYKDGMLGDFIQCEGESNTCSNGVGFFNINYSVKDHSSNNYIKLKDKFQSGRKAKASIKRSSPSPSASPTDDSWIRNEHKAEFLDGEFDVPNSDLFEGQPDDEL